MGKSKIIQKDKAINILFLTLKTFSFTGGIEKACRSLMYALELQENIVTRTWSMYDRPQDHDNSYGNAKNFKGFGANKIAFALNVAKNCLKFDRVILSHINLLIFGMIIKKIKPTTQIILWAHGIEIWRPIAKWKRKFLAKHVDIWAVSTYTKQQIVERHGLKEKNIKILHNTLDPFFQIPSIFEKPPSLLDKYDINKNQFILFTLTRLAGTEHNKNYDSVLKATKLLIKQYPNLVYLIGGKANDEEQKRLETYIAQNELQKHVRLLGFIDEKEITAHFLLADCFILPSQKEGFGLVFIEAATCGCQIIGGNVDGSTDALLQGKLGQMVNPNSEEEIIEAIKKAINNKNHQPKLQQQLAVEHFGFEQYVQRVKELLN